MSLAQVPPGLMMRRRAAQDAALRLQAAAIRYAEATSGETDLRAAAGDLEAARACGELQIAAKEFWRAHRAAGLGP